MKYTIGFKSGNKLELEVTDGITFVSDIIDGIKKNLAATKQWHYEPGILLAVSEVEFIVPAHLMKQEMPNASGKPTDAAGGRSA